MIYIIFSESIFLFLLQIRILFARTNSLIRGLSWINISRKKAHPPWVDVNFKGPYKRRNAFQNGINIFDEVLDETIYGQSISRTCGVNSPRNFQCTREQQKCLERITASNVAVHLITGKTKTIICGSDCNMNQLQCLDLLSVEIGMLGASQLNPVSTLISRN